MTLKRRKIECMFGTFVALQKILASKAKKKKIYLDCFHGCEKKNKLYAIKIYNITEKSKQMNNDRHFFQCRKSLSHQQHSGFLFNKIYIS